MNIVKPFFLIVLLAVSNLAHSQDINPTEVKKVMKQVADWQIAHFSDLYSAHEKPHHPLDWTNGALYVGMVK